uniref:Putative salivary lipocalin n=1 Tax=Ixodes ricinus TaxID=34613 RepID=A0A147BWU6_IXORI
MAWTIKVAVLCAICHLIVANNKYKSPLQVFKKPFDIKSLFEKGKTYYVAAGTERKGPELFPLYILYCGEVTVKTTSPTITIQKRYLYRPKGRWSWLPVKYSVTIETDKKEARKYAAVKSMHGQKTLVATLYLLWLENNTCALFYNKLTDNCEAWEFSKHRLNEIATSDCAKLTVVCNKTSYKHYMEECYTH